MATTRKPGRKHVRVPSIPAATDARIALGKAVQEWQAIRVEYHGAVFVQQMAEVLDVLDRMAAAPDENRGTMNSFAAIARRYNKRSSYTFRTSDGQTITLPWPGVPTKAAVAEYIAWGLVRGGYETDKDLTDLATEFVYAFEVSGVFPPVSEGAVARIFAALQERRNDPEIGTKTALTKMMRKVLRAYGLPALQVKDAMKGVDLHRALTTTNFLARMVIESTIDYQRGAVRERLSDD